MTKKEKIVIEFFDWNYFWIPEKSNKQIGINKKSSFFEERYPNIIQNIMDVFNENFDNWTITDYTSFINEDRCVMFEINTRDSLFFIYLSIFNYFMVREIKGGLGNYTYHLIDTGENEKIDKIYKLIIKKLYNYDFTWLPKETLNFEIKEFNLGAHEVMKKDGVNSPIDFSRLLTSR